MPRPGSATQWVDQAEGDLRLACLGRASGGIPLELICFHAQQTAEKCLKAALLSLGLSFPFSHDLEGLVAELERHGVVLPGDVGDAASLSPFAVETRYPGDWVAISEEETDLAIGTASRVLIWAQAFVTEPRGRPE